MSVELWEKKLGEEQRERKASGLWRDRRVSGSAQHSFIEIDGEWRTNFSSNDYLGLAGHPAIASAISSGIDQWGVGAGASHLICGHQSLHQELEEELAEFVGAERALLFSNGYMANLALNSVFAKKRDLLLHDRLNHASLIDGARLSSGMFKRFRHGDLKHARKQILTTDFDSLILISDGVFSMDGDIAPIGDLKSLADQYGGLLCIDDAHGFGVLGADGAGSLACEGLAPVGNVLSMGTLSKALGGYGAFIAGDALFIEHLVQYARAYVYTTALPPSTVLGNLAALKVLREQQSSRMDHVSQLIECFKNGSDQIGLTLMKSQTPIQPVLIGDESEAIRVSHELSLKGFFVPAIRTPTVMKGEARLRVTLTASHSVEQVRALLVALAQVVNRKNSSIRTA